MKFNYSGNKGQIIKLELHWKHMSPWAVLHADSRLKASEWMGQWGTNAVNAGLVIAALTRA